MDVHEYQKIHTNRYTGDLLEGKKDAVTLGIWLLLHMDSAVDHRHNSVTELQWKDISTGP